MIPDIVVRYLIADVALFVAIGFAWATILLEIALTMPATAKTVSLMSRWTAAALIVAAVVLALI